MSTPSTARPSHLVLLPDSSDPPPSAVQPTDAELVAGVLAGQRREAERLYDRIEPAIHSALCKVLGRGDRDHQDLAHDALERVVSSLFRGTYSHRCNLRSWGSVIATRLAIDVLRRRRRERDIFAMDADIGAPEPAELAPLVPDRRNSSRELAAQLRWALGRVSPEKAEAVLLFDVMGHELAEVARLTSVSVAAAQSRLVRGRKELRKLLEETREDAKS